MKEHCCVFDLKCSSVDVAWHGSVLQKNYGWRCKARIDQLEASSTKCQNGPNGSCFYWELELQIWMLSVKEKTLSKLTSPIFCQCRLFMKLILKRYCLFLEHNVCMLSFKFRNSGQVYTGPTKGLSFASSKYVHIYMNNRKRCIVHARPVVGSVSL